MAEYRLWFTESMAIAEAVECVDNGELIFEDVWAQHQADHKAKVLRALADLH